MGFTWRVVAVTATASVALSGCAAIPSLRDPQPAATLALTPVRVTGLFAVQSVTMGSLVVDGQGFVLYRYDRDTASPSGSTCVGAPCGTDWLPAPYSDNLKVSGIDRQLIGRYVRSDGLAQLTLAGWPLYGYAGDRMPGDTTGQGEDGSWWAITPDGSKAR